MSKHGKRAPGMVQVSVVLEEEIRDKLKIIAKEERRSLSNYIAHEITKCVAEELAVAEDQAPYTAATPAAPDIPTALPDSGRKHGKTPGEKVRRKTG